MQVHCEAEGGFFNPVEHACVTHWQIDGFCVKISQDDDENWDADGQWDTIGCVGEEMEIASYRHAAFHDQSQIIEGLEFSNFTSIVRSGYDPYLLAEELTEATFTFGLKSGDWKIIGYVGLIV